ncbi:sensor histidine kinase [Nitrogeniibacter aestuarii]|uniref:sensor histidine kinase n=1 Tax=Nitrogeniibacter aestuarii TaxID=2815343 RepID=UPI001E541BC4|nr:sensor histidine kinase [Nitrogeniibacter aestuarii]
MRTLLRIGAPLILPWWIVIPAITWLVYELRLERDLERLEQQTVESMAQANDIIVDSIRQLWLDSRMITRVAATQLGNPAATEGQSVLASVMNDFMQTHPRYTQARLLDTGCKERIRFDRRGDLILQATEKDLQDKSDRYYCRETLSVQADQAYLSPLDLNVERGEIVLPHEPTLRIGTRVFGPDGEALGLIVLNFNAGDILATFSRSGGGQMSLLNDEGYWLASQDPADSFGFMLERPDRRISLTQPDLWQAMTNSSAVAGHVKTSESLWLYRRLPAVQVSTTLKGPTWYIAGHLDPAKRDALVQEQAWQHVLLGGLALMVVTALAAMLTQRDARQARTSAALAAANIRLRESLERLESSLDERVRSEKLASLGLLVAGVAHELNTPLGGAMLTSTQLEDELRTLEQAYAAGLRQSDIQRHIERSQEGLQLLHRNLDRAGRLISRFKGVASDRATSERSRFTLRETVDDILALIHSETKHSPIRVTVDVDESIVMDSYPGPLGQVIQNLVQNAFRHGFRNGATGTIVITARRAGDEVTLTVEDDGGGIPQGAQARIWDPFFTTARSSGGTGLGLHLSQQLVGNVLGGKLELAHSAPGEGTCMRLTMPCTAPEHVTEEASTGAT